MAKLVRHLTSNEEIVSSNLAEGIILFFYSYKNPTRSSLVAPFSALSSLGPIDLSHDLFGVSSSYI
ncbi:unnamed protein product [Debaryomyces fabryi]|nr:unnamed protein product [Debaryomyces fabryi]